MEGEMPVSKQIHLDEQACSVPLYYAQPFPHGVCARASWSLAVLLCIRVVGGRRAGTPSSPYFLLFLEGFHAIQRAVTGREVNN